MCSIITVMSTVKEGRYTMTSFMLWLVWVAVATVVLGGAVYLFVGGSVFFNRYNTMPIIAYRQVSAEGMSLTGSVMLQNNCEQLHLVSEGDASMQVLNFTFEDRDDCDGVRMENVPETFFIELEGDGETQVQAVVGGVKRDIIIK